MKKKKQKRTRIPAKSLGSSSDPTDVEINSDKTGTDVNADHTVKLTGKHKFNKPKREADPDNTSPETNPATRL